ncbi:MAG: DMT family transporter, partial [Coprobacillus sp.]
MSIYIQLFIASFFWGTNIIVMKLLLNEIPFLFLATLRVFLSLLFLTVYMKYKKISFEVVDKKKMIVIGVLAIYLNFYFTFLGMNQVKGIDNALMNALAPTLTFLFSILLLKKKPNRNEWIAIDLSVFAFLLSIEFRIFSIQVGFWLLFIGMFLYMLSNTLIQKWKMSSTLSLSFYELLYGFIP